MSAKLNKIHRAVRKKHPQPKQDVGELQVPLFNLARVLTSEFFESWYEEVSYAVGRMHITDFMKWYRNTAIPNLAKELRRVSGERTKRQLVTLKEILNADME